MIANSCIFFFSYMIGQAPPHFVLRTGFNLPEQVSKFEYRIIRAKRALFPVLGTFTARLRLVKADQSTG